MRTSSKGPLTMGRISSGASNRFKMTSMSRTSPPVVSAGALEPRPFLGLGQLRHGFGPREEPREPAVLACHEVEFLGKPEGTESRQVVGRVAAARADLLAPVQIPASTVGARRKVVHRQWRPSVSIHPFTR